MEEATGKEGLLNTIRPPKLEDAGLENCALPPEAIREAFFKAADSIRSGARSILGSSTTDDLGENDDCVQDPGPTNGESSDALVGIAPTAEPRWPCGTERGGGLPKVIGDEVATDVTESSDKLLGTEIPEEVKSEGGKACVDGFQGLKIGDNKKLETDDEQEEKEQPIFTETYL